MSRRPHRVASLVLLAVLAWTSAQAAVCLGWCDDALTGGHAAQHAGHGAAQAEPAAEAPCHRTASAADVRLTPTEQVSCDDPFSTLDMRVRPAPSRAVVAAPIVADLVIGARQAFETVVQAAAFRADSGPPYPAPTRAPLVLRI